MNKFILSALMISNFAWGGKTPDITTHAEKTGWIETGRAQEAEQLCHNFEKKFPSKVKCRSYGKTPEKRNLMYMVVGNPASPVVWVQAGIHAGEIDGKDAVFLLLKEILEKKRTSGLLKGLCLVFVPIVNLDGHERFGAYNRPNQIGPKEMGWRTTSQNINLNRDFLKVDSSEMRDLLTLWHKVDPVLSLDLHVTDGAQFQPEVGLIIHPKKSFGDSNLHEAGSRFEDEIISKLKDLKHLALPFYPSFENNVDPKTGFSVHVSTPRFAHGYWYNNNRLGVLVETHSWKDYATRVKNQHDVVMAALEIAQRDALSWKKYAQELDRESLAGKSVPLSYKHNDKFRLIEFPGYKYSVEKSNISGADVIKYDPSLPEIWKVPFYEELRPVLTVVAPAEGYYLQPADAELILPKLVAHGVIYSQIKQSHAREVEVFHAIKAQFSVGSFEGHQNLVVEGEWKKENVEIPAHTIFIPINQPKGRLLLQMFEPLSLDSFLWWGFFNRSFERKEYMEDYVAEDIAVEMLKNPLVKEEFFAKLKDDKEFAKSPEKRFEFFYRKHSSWDVRFNRYPVFRK